jgi:hypothetical protein
MRRTTNFHFSLLGLLSLAGISVPDGDAEVSVDLTYELEGTPSELALHDRNAVNTLINTLNRAPEICDAAALYGLELSELPEKMVRLKEQRETNAAMLKEIQEILSIFSRRSTSDSIKNVSRETQPTAPVEPEPEATPECPVGCECGETPVAVAPAVPEPVESGWTLTTGDMATIAMHWPDAAKYIYENSLQSMADSTLVSGPVQMTFLKQFFPAAASWIVRKSTL